MTDEGIAKDFAQDLPASETKILAAIQGQTSGPNELGAKVTTAAWRNKPSFYIVADHDRMIAPELEKKLAAQMHAKTIHIASSHVPMLSHPPKLLSLLLKQRDPSRRAELCGGRITHKGQDGHCYPKETYDRKPSTVAGTSGERGL